MGPDAHPEPAATVDDLLRRMRDGDTEARGVLFELVYGELKAMARRRTARQSPAHTLPATALVNEAYLRMCGHATAAYSSRAHFFAVAAHAMRSVLVDHAKRKGCRKRQPPGTRAGEELDQVLADFETHDDLLDLDGALQRLEARDPQLAHLVEMRYFAGLTLSECAQALGVSERTAHRWWDTARAFLHRELRGA
ncbi:MAG: ECF-type sigma factor [Planctomycetota bacterium]